jgi:4-hydroxybenzoate polyprenyltransferase
MGVTAEALFCALSSGIYAINDAHDREADRVHPLKRHRPVAAGRIPHGRAIFAGFVLALGATAGAMLVEPAFGGIAAAYVGLNLAYTKWLKSLVILDVFTIAAFFLLRLVAGSLVISVQPSIWLLLCGGLLALYLGFTKRRHELATLGDGSEQHRAVLTHYSRDFLDQMSSVLLSVTVVAYIMYTLSSETAEALGTDALTYSVAFVLYGVFRYLYLVHRKGAGSPTETLLADGQLLVVVGLWLSYCAWVIYVAG